MRVTRVPRYNHMLADIVFSINAQSYIYYFSFFSKLVYRIESILDGSIPIRFDFLIPFVHSI